MSYIFLMLGSVGERELLNFETGIGSNEREGALVVTYLYVSYVIKYVCIYVSI